MPQQRPSVHVTTVSSARYFSGSSKHASQCLADPQVLQTCFSELAHLKLVYVDRLIGAVSVHKLVQDAVVVQLSKNARRQSWQRAAMAVVDEVRTTQQPSW